MCLQLLILLVLLNFLSIQAVSAEQVADSAGSNQEKQFAGRRVVVHLPPAYDNSTAFPVVLFLHGGAANVNSALRDFGFNTDADRSGYIVVYPSGTGKGSKLLSWNSGGCCSYAFKKNVDDVGFIRNLLQWLAENYKIDNRRIYATGFSNGAMMAYRLAFDLPGKLAAIASISGALSKTERSLPEPISVMIVHGTKDKSIPIDGSPGKWDRLGYGYKVGAQPLTDTIQYFVQQNGCSAQAEVHKDGPVTRSTYGGGKNGSEVVVYIVEGYGHAWHGGNKSWFLAAKPYEGFSTNQAMLDFFSRHQRP